jgi:hypothetical protein
MLNSVSGHLLSMSKNEIKEIFNTGKTTFYILKVLNAHISKQILYFNMFNCYSKHYLVLFNIFLKKIV